MIITLLNNKEPGVILFKSKKKDLFSEGGGNMDDSDIDVRATATRELREESANLFNLSVTNLNNSQFV